MKRGYPNINFRMLIKPLVDLNGGYIPIFDGRDEIEFLLK
jgi:hypothetical protein